jgi:hypothetical protein
MWHTQRSYYQNRPSYLTGSSGTGRPIVRPVAAAEVSGLLGGVSEPSSSATGESIYQSGNSIPYSPGSLTVVTPGAINATTAFGVPTVQADGITYTNDASQTGLTNGTTLIASNSGGGTNTALTAVNGTWTVNNTAPWNSTQDYEAAAAVGIKSSLQLNAGTTASVSAARFYDQLGSTPAPSANQIWCQWGGTGANWIGVTSGQRLIIALNSTVVYTSSTYTILGSTVYRLEVVGTTGAGGATVHVALYVGDSLTPVDSYDAVDTANTTATIPVGIFIGKQSVSGNWTTHTINNIAFRMGGASNQFIGPAAQNASITATTVQATSSFGTANLSTGETVTATAISATSSFGTASISAGQTASPTAIAATSNFGTTSISASQTAAPTTIAATSSFGTTVVSTGQTVTATAIGAVTAFGVLMLSTTGAKLLRNSFEGQTNGGTLDATTSATSGDPLTPTLGTGTATYSNTHPGTGTMGALLTPGTGAIYLSTGSVLHGTNVAAEWDWYYPGVPTGGAIAHAAIYTATGILAGQINVSPSGRLQVTDKFGTAQWTATSALVAGTLYRISWQMFVSGTYGSEALAYYTPDSSVTAVESSGTLSCNTHGGYASEFRVGTLGSANLGYSSMYLDSIQVTDTGNTPIGPYPVPVAPTAIAATTSFGSPVVSTGSTVTATAVPATASFGTAAVSTGSTVTATRVPGTTSFGTAAISTGAGISPTAIIATSSFGAAVVSAGQTVTATAIAATSTLYSPVVTSAASITPTAVPGSTTIPSVTPTSSVSITPTRVPSTTSFGTAAISTGSGVTATAVPGSTTFGTAAISTGSTVSPTAIPATSTLPTPAVGAATNANITPTAIASASTLYAPTITSAASVTPTRVPGTTTLYPPTIASSVAITPTAVPSSTTLYAPTITSAASPVPTAISASTAFGTAAPSTGSTVTPTAVAAISTLYGPSITTGSGASISASAISATTTFGAAVASSSVTINPSAIGATSAIPTPVVTIGVTFYTNDAGQTGQPNGTTLLPGNSGGGTNTAFTAVNGTWTIEASNPWDSTQDYFSPAATATKNSLQLNPATSTTVEAVRFYDYLTGTPIFPSSNGEWLQFGGTGINFVAVDTGGHPYLVVNSVTLYTSSYVLLASTRYRVELVFAAAGTGNATISWAIYVGDSLTPADSFTATNATMTANPGSFFFGKQTTTGNWAAHTVNNISVRVGGASNQFIGPAASVTSASATAIAATTSFGTPAVGAGAGAAPTAIAATTAIPTPTVTVATNANISPLPILGSTELFVPDIPFTSLCYVPTGDASGAANGIVAGDAFGSTTSNVMGAGNATAPCIATGVLIQAASPVQATTQFGTPQLHTGSTLTPSAIVVPSTLYAPTVTSSASPAATAINATTTFGVPALHTGATPTPTAVPGTTSFGAPVVTSSASPSATAIPASTSFGTAVLHTGSTVLATAISSTATLYTPTVLTGSAANAQPTAIPASTSFGTPAISVGSIIPATAIASTSTIYSPALHTGGTAAPTVVPATTTIPTPIIGSATVVSPAVISATTAVNPPTVLAGTSAFPQGATIAASTTLPTPQPKVGSTVFAVVASASSTLPAPSVLAVTRTSPTAIGALSTLYSPSVTTTSTASATPAVIPASSIVYTPAPRVGSTVSVTFIDAHGATFQPAVASDSTLLRIEVSGTEPSAHEFGREPAMAIAGARLSTTIHGTEPGQLS